MVALTKSSILQGVKTPKLKNIKSLDGELWLRPLSSAEIDDASYIEAKGMGNVDQTSRSKMNNHENASVNQNNKLNVEKVAKSRDEAKYHRIFLSLDNPKNENDPWTLEDIKQLPIDATDEIDDIILELSGAKVTNQDVKNFPKNK